MRLATTSDKESSPYDLGDPYSSGEKLHKFYLLQACLYQVQPSCFFAQACLYQVQPSCFFAQACLYQVQPSYYKVTASLYQVRPFYSFAQACLHQVQPFCFFPQASLHKAQALLYERSFPNSLLPTLYSLLSHFSILILSNAYFASVNRIYLYAIVAPMILCITMKEKWSIDGRGVRGLIPALIMTEVKTRTHRPVALIGISLALAGGPIAKADQPAIATVQHLTEGDRACYVDLIDTHL